jgi:hypothetical protein
LTEPAGTGCIIPNIHILAHAYVVTINSKNYAEFTPAEGTTFASVVLEGCSGVPALAGTYPVKGTVFALVNNATSEIEFSAGAPNNKLKFEGNPAEIIGNDRVLMEGGGKIEVK